MLSIQTNVNSLVAQQNLNVNNAFQSKTIQQLTSGYRINQSGDDAAGLAVANKFRNATAELTQGVANGNDAAAQLQIMDGGISNISQILDRLKTLATQSASGTLTDASRLTLNAEFQTDLAEIDRQAESIGLNAGGIFNKNLDVYLGSGSGSTSPQNGVVTLGLSQSAVDSQSLGMKGFEALAGTVGTTDLGGGSSTSVAKILAETANKASEATAGSTDLYFVGPGFSDADRVKVSVSLTGVTDTASLVTQINSAIAKAGTGTTQAGANFARAAIVASVNTDSSGKQQLAFTSSTAAFQVMAGDQMANALLGNFNGPGPAGASLRTTVSGVATAAIAAGSTTSFTPATNQVTVRIQGAGLSGPVDLTLDKVATPSDSTVGGAVADLIGQVSASATLAAAGITVSVQGNALQFASAHGESINVMASGDTSNQLGLGAFVMGSGATKVDYSSIQGVSYDYGAAVSDHATMQVSVNGAAATNLDLNLTGGDASAASITTAAFVPGTAITTGVNDTLNFSVDGIAVSAALSANVSDAQAAAAGGLFASHATITLHSAYGAQQLASGDVTSFNFTNNVSTFGVKVDGQATAQTITLNGNYANGTAYANAIQAQLTGATVAYSNNKISITSNTTGTNSHVQLIDGLATEAALVGSGAVTPADYSTVSKTILVTTHDQGQATITLSRADVTAADFVGDINYNNGSGTVGFHAAVVNGNVALISDDAGLGATLSTVTLAAGTATLADLGLTASTVHGNAAPLSYMNLSASTVNGVAGNNQFLVSSDTVGPTLVTVTAAANATGTTYDDGTAHTNIATTLDGLVSGLGLTATLSAAGNLVLTSTTSGGGPNTSVSIGAPPAVNGTVSSALGGSGLGFVAGTYTGGTASATTVADQIQTAIDSATANGATNGATDAHATATANSDGTITITNDNKGAAHSISDFTGSTATFLTTGASAVTPGANRSGADMETYLNGLFSASALQPAQLTAAWNGTGGNAGTLTIASGNNTNFRVNSGTDATASMTTSTTSLAAGVNFSANAAAHQAFQISVDGGTTWADIVLGTDTTGSAQNVVDALNAQFTANSVDATATLSGNYVKLASNTIGAGASIQIQNYSAADQTAGYSNALATGKVLAGLTTQAVTSDADLGFGVSGASFTGAPATNLKTAAAGATNYVFDSGGASSANLYNSTTTHTDAIAFNPLQFGNDSQAITITANGADGLQHSQTITLKNIVDTGTPANTNTSGRSIDEAISYINEQLQKSNDPTMEQIAAVKENNRGNDQINFISALSSFNVSLGSTANAALGDGLDGGVSANYALSPVGTGANMSIATLAGAKAAITAVAAAVAKLGTAQAAVGNGENQLTYAISLAQSQITNQSAAESYIRDANVAQQAANLTKAQVLQQASIAAMAQANSAPQAVLALLRG